MLVVVAVACGFFNYTKCRVRAARLARLGNRMLVGFGLGWGGGGNAGGVVVGWFVGWLFRATRRETFTPVY